MIIKLLFLLVVVFGVGIGLNIDSFAAVPSATSDVMDTPQQTLVADRAYDELSQYVTINGTSKISDFMKSIPHDDRPHYEKILDKILDNHKKSSQQDKNKDKK